MNPSTGITLSPKSEEPLYRQLFDQIASRVRAGTYPDGHRLPPTRDMAEELGTHRNTVVRAYAELEAAGFLSSRVGRGTFVAKPPAPARAAEPPSRNELPWAALTSQAMLAEPLARTERFAQSVTSTEAVNLNRMHPSADLLPDALVRRCFDYVLRTQGARALSYAPREGLPRLREMVAKDLLRQGVPASPEAIIITAGSQQALDVLARALVNPGDPFLCDISTYTGALQLFSMARARLIGIPNDDDGPDLGALETQARSGAKGLYLMPNCSNPTGTRVSRERREALIAWSHAAGVPLIEDDYASDLHLDGRAPLPALRALDGDVSYLGTYSKKLVPALRIGYLLCPRALMPRLGSLKHAMDLGTSPIVQHALAEFLDRGYLEAHLKRTVPEYRKRRDALEEGLRKHLPSGIKWKSPETGLLLWLPLPEDIDVEALFIEAQRQGVLVSPGSLNSVNPSAPSGLKLAFCAEGSARLAEGAKRLGKAFNELARRTKARPSSKQAVRYEVM